MWPVRLWSDGVWIRLNPDSIRPESSCTYTHTYTADRKRTEIHLLGCLHITTTSIECMKTELVPWRMFGYRRLENVSLLLLQHWTTAPPVQLYYDVWQNMLYQSFSKAVSFHTLISSFPFDSPGTLMQ
jgi:hypothetical protein